MSGFTRRITLAFAALCLAGAAHAQSTRAGDDSLYQAFGGQSGLVRLMDDFMTRLLADARMRPFFKDADQDAVKKQLVAQFCELAGGPCRRDGPTMKEAHDGMDIRRGDFNALVEVLQDAMDAQGIAFRAQNRLLAQLAPMHREIVNTP
ncbi:MAG: group 1 truncated hemoglobin [Piscinibacter sp.]